MMRIRAGVASHWMAEVLLRILDGEYTEGRVRVTYAHPSVHPSIHPSHTQTCIWMCNHMNRETERHTVRIVDTANRREVRR